MLKATVTPVETAFLTVTLSSWLFAINRIGIDHDSSRVTLMFLVDLCFFIDAVLNFFVMVGLLRSHPLNHFL